MPGTPEEIRAAMEGLSPEQQMQFVAELERRRGTEAQPKKDPAAMFRDQLATAGSFGHTPQPEEMPEGAAGKLALAGTIASLPLGVQAAGAPLAALRGLALSAAGASAGGYAGSGLGRGLEMVGAPEGTSEVGGTLGGLVGGVAGPMGGPMALAKILKVGGGKGGMLARLIGGGEEAAKAVAPEVAEEAAKRAATAARAKELDLAAKEARLASIAAREARAKEMHQIRVEAARAKAAGKTGPKAVPKPEPVPEPAPAPRTEGATALKPEPEFIPDEAVSLVAEPLPFRPRPSKGTTTMATNLGGKAKPGPAPTPPDELEATLQASIDAAKAAKAGAVRGKGTPLLEEALDTASGLKGPRIQEGAQRVGKGIGMTKEEVRTATGPLLGEKLGEASPIIPKEPWTRIVETMKALPKTGGHREAYVARAAPGKNRGQMEQLRRTLEQLGLLLPIGAGGVALSE